jgi:malate/lactate dehydrogenase
VQQLKWRKQAEKSGQKVTAFLPPDDGMKKAFSGADVVVIPAGIPRKYRIQTQFLALI